MMIHRSKCESVAAFYKISALIFVALRVFGSGLKFVIVKLFFRLLTEMYRVFRFVNMALNSRLFH